MKPNVIMIVSDQHNAKVLGAASDSCIRTPNLDKLSSLGVTYDNCYCAAPLCGPSRASLLTGQYPHKHCVLINQKSLSSSTPTIAHSLGIAGYESVLVGRMDFREFDQYHGYEKHLTGDITSIIPGYDNLEDILGDLKRTLPQSLDGVTKAGPGSTSCINYDNIVAETSVKFLENREDSRPLFLTVGFFAPHNPFICEKELFDYYIKCLPDEIEEDNFDEPVYDSDWKRLRKLDGISKAEIKKARAAYYGLVEFLDKKIGQVIDKVAETLDMENTIIIYVSDHGESMGNRGMFYKSHLYQDSVRVPMIIVSPDQQLIGSKNHDLVSLIDVVPTIIDYTESSALPNMDGVSLRFKEENAGTFNNRFIFSELGKSKTIGPCAAVLKDKYKFNFYSDAKYENQLFNLRDDPKEINNLIGKAEYKEMVKEYQDELTSHWDPDVIKKQCEYDMQNFKILREWSAKVKLNVEDNSEERWIKDLYN